VSLGGDLAAMLRKFSLEPAALTRPNTVIPYELMTHLLEFAAAELNCLDFGMRLAALQSVQGPTKVLGPLDIAMRNAPTLGDALRYCADHVHACSTATRVSFDKLRGDPRVFMLIEIPSTDLIQQRQVVEHALALSQHAISAISGGQVQAREVWLTHEALSPPATYRSYFNVPVRCGQSMNGLFLDEHDLGATVPDADPQLYEIATSFIDDHYPTAAISLSSRVRTIIGRLLVDGSCTHVQVATALGLHPRTLQRRLREEGESFESIKDSVRRDVALRYLQQPNVSLVRVTEILGYSETSVLSRSCHRWFRASPRELRDELSRSTG
jgi:AraC-like DNA-binding protein